MNIKLHGLRAQVKCDLCKILHVKQGSNWYILLHPLIHAANSTAASSWEILLELILTCL